MKCIRCEGNGWLYDSEGDGEECPSCRGTGEIVSPLAARRPSQEPTLADVIALLERQAKTCERIAATLTEIQYTVRQLK